jgi:hypothetical protein
MSSTTLSGCETTPAEQGRPQQRAPVQQQQPEPGAKFSDGDSVSPLLGAAGFGLVGLVMGYASTVNSLLSFRMSELVVRYGGEYYRAR